MNLSLLPCHTEPTNNWGARDERIHKLWLLHTNQGRRDEFYRKEEVRSGTRLGSHVDCECFTTTHLFFSNNIICPRRNVRNVRTRNQVPDPRRWRLEQSPRRLLHKYDHWKKKKKGQKKKLNGVGQKQDFKAVQSVNIKLVIASICRLLSLCHGWRRRALIDSLNLFACVNMH